MSSSALSEEGSDLDEQPYNPTTPETHKGAMEPNQPYPATDAPVPSDSIPQEDPLEGHSTGPAHHPFEHKWPSTPTASTMPQPHPSPAAGVA